MIFNKLWFPASVNAKTPFGWDPARNRIHPAQDYAPLNGKREETIASTIIDGPVSWLIDNQGNSVLRQFGNGIEVRYYHFKRDELSSDVIAALTVKGLSLKAGTPIGPANHIGISVPGNGNDGSHVHLCIVAFPEIYKDIENIMSNKFWHVNKIDDFARLYGEQFIVKVAEWKIAWMNENVIARFDPLTQKNAYYLNPRIVLGV